MIYLVLEFGCCCYSSYGTIMCLQKMLKSSRIETRSITRTENTKKSKRTTCSNETNWSTVTYFSQSRHERALSQKFCKNCKITEKSERRQTLNIWCVYYERTTQVVRASAERVLWRRMIIGSVVIEGRARHHNKCFVDIKRCNQAAVA